MIPNRVLGPIEAAQHARHLALRAKLFPKVPPVIQEKPKPRVIFVGKARFQIDPFAPRCAWPRVVKQRQPGDPIPFKEVIRAVCETFGVTKEDLKGPRQIRRIALPRQIGMYLAATLSRLSLPENGRRFGDRDHTTALHAVRKIRGLIEIGHASVSCVEEIRQRLERGDFS
jgi:hypothetical protein